MLKKLPLLAFVALLSGCAATSESLQSLVGGGAPQVPANWQAERPDFGFMSAFVNKKYIYRATQLTPRTEDNGRTYVFNEYKLRNTPQPGVLQVTAKPASCDEASAVLEGQNKLVITCVTWHNDYRSTLTPNQWGGFDELTEAKLTDGLNFLQDFEYYSLYQFQPYTDAVYREQMNARERDARWAAEQARQDREDKRESDAATARAFGNAMATLGKAANQSAQYQAAQAAQARAQAEARRQDQAQAQRDAAARQAQQAQENARMATQKQFDIARQYKEQQAAQAQRRAEADAARKADAQARQDAAAKQRQAALTVEQNRGSKTASQVAALPSKPSATASAPPPLPTTAGKDLNCNTERQCFGECLKGPKDGVYACQRACTARSTCKVSLQ